MPQIGPDLWKTALSFFWFRQFRDGRIEQEFDLDTGQIRPWGSKTPEGLKKVGWLPVDQELARKMRAYGEFGIPTQAPAVMIDVKPGEVPLIYKDATVWNGYQVRCKACNTVFKSIVEPKACPTCDAKPAWRCPKCTALSDTEICPHCQKKGRIIDPFEKRNMKWEEVEYFLGIEGKFRNRFNTTRLTTEH